MPAELAFRTVACTPRCKKRRSRRAGTSPRVLAPPRCSTVTSGSRAGGSPSSIPPAPRKSAGVVPRWLGMVTCTPRCDTMPRHVRRTSTTGGAQRRTGGTPRKPTRVPRRPPAPSGGARRKGRRSVACERGGWDFIFKDVCSGAHAWYCGRSFDDRSSNTDTRRP